MSKIIELNKLNKYWQKNCKCELKKTATQAVLGSGNNDSLIVFIGEAPGKKEDEVGKPFIGSAGKFLDELLSVVGIGRENIYITNIVKYRPPNNRDPLPQEKEDCKDWLENELKIISPKLIVLLGKHSMSHFFPKEKISEVHGKFLIKNIPGLGEQSFFILYHPAAALYNGSLRTVLIKDFKKMKTIFQKMK